MTSFGERLRTLRDARGLRQRDLAAATELSRPSIANMERDRQEPTMTGLIQLADVLGVPIGVLAGTEPMPDVRAVPQITIMAEFRVECTEHGLVGRFPARLDAKDAQDKHRAEDAAALARQAPARQEHTT